MGVPVGVRKRVLFSLPLIAMALSGCDRCSADDCKLALGMRSLSEAQMNDQAHGLSTEQLWRIHLWEMNHSRPPSSRIGTSLLLRQDVADVISADFKSLGAGFDQEVAIELLIAAARNGNQLQIENLGLIKEKCIEIYAINKVACKWLDQKTAKNGTEVGKPGPENRGKPENRDGGT